MHMIVVINIISKNFTDNFIEKLYWLNTNHFVSVIGNDVICNHFVSVIGYDVMWPLPPLSELNFVFIVSCL